MSEPISGAAAGAAGWNFIGGLAGIGAIGAGLAALVVMCMTRPKDDKEWTVGLVSTLISSLCGCCGVVVYFGLQRQMMADVFGLIALGGLFFACGLPGWAIVRWLFNYIERRKEADIGDVIRDAKGVL